ncbi:hypothetical protein BTVI_37112 [Pitangus sulphuratus]|nr:hypothetical protein BTVI_37112 [Pitangus sulphuratus]
MESSSEEPNILTTAITQLLSWAGNATNHICMLQVNLVHAVTLGDVPVPGAVNPFRLGIVCISVIWEYGVGNWDRAGQAAPEVLKARLWREIPGEP